MIVNGFKKPDRSSTKGPPTFFFFLNQHLYPATPTTPILTITEADKRSGSAVLYYERVGGN